MQREREGEREDGRGASHESFQFSDVILARFAKAEHFSFPSVLVLECVTAHFTARLGFADCSYKFICACAMRVHMER